MTAETTGRTLELFFIDGRPDGMLTAEVFNWTGHILMAPRTRLVAMLARKEANYTGIYILVGEQDGEPIAYIGEGEDISYRIKNHDANKDWWTQAILVTSAANNLHKAHVKYLEARLIEESRSANRTNLENGNTPSRPSLSESAQSNMETFLDYLLMVLPALGVDVFVKRTRQAPVVVVDRLPLESLSAETVFEISSRKGEYHGVAVMERGDFVIQKGSKARKNWVGIDTATSSYGKLHADLKKQGVLVETGDFAEFSTSYAFNSPSAAAAVMTGRPSNGLVEWKVRAGGMTYKEWEKLNITKSSSD